MTNGFHLDFWIFLDFVYTFHIPFFKLISLFLGINVIPLSVSGELLTYSDYSGTIAVQDGSYTYIHTIALHQQGNEQLLPEIR